MNGKKYGIIFEDEWLVAVNKPSGLLVIPTPKKETDTLSDLINYDLDQRGVAANAYPCHRLDRETSGVIVYAKGKKSQQLVMEEFRKRAVSKKYIAIVQGNVKPPQGVINTPIFNRTKRRSESAVTKYRVIGKRPGYSMLEAEPVTGRTNQIRIHLAKAGYPIMGESVYAFRRDFSIKFNRVALHARKLSLKHPATGSMVTFEAPVPEDMEKLWKEKIR